MHEFEASDALICLIQEVFMEICREEDRSGVPTKEEEGGREEEENVVTKDLFFCLGSGAGRSSVFGLGHQNIWARNSRSGDTFPAH
jgi:hypothetical protein